MHCRSTWCERQGVATMNQQLQTNDTLKRGQAFLETIRGISRNNRAISQSITNSFELFDYNDYRTSLDGIRRHSYRHSVRYLQESGETWQFIIESDQDKRGYVYRAPYKSGNRAFLPAIPADIRRKISQRYGVDVPADGDAWQWLAKHREIPILITEGGGKALSALSHGFVAIGLYGCTCLGSDDLKPYLKGRDVAIALDSDTKPSAILAVQKAITKHLPNYEKVCKSVKVVQWNPKYKGLDDLLAAKGEKAYTKALAKALTPSDWRTKQFDKTVEIAKQRIGAITHDLEISIEDFQKLDYDSLMALTGNARDIFVNAYKGAGKTSLAINLIKAHEYALIPCHRRALAQSNAVKFGADYRTDCDRVKGALITDTGYVTKLSFCNESIFGLKPQIDSMLDRGAIVFNDEFDQQIESLATSSTHSKDGRRRLHDDAFWNMQIRAPKTFSVSADLTDYEARYFERKTGRKPFVIKVVPIKKDYKALLYETFPDFWKQFLEAKSQGKRILILANRKEDCKFLAHSFDATAIYADNANDYREFLDNPNDWLATNQPQLMAVSPVLGTGFSITHDAFDVVFGWFHADNLAAKALMQFTERYRLPVERHLFCDYSSNRFNGINVESLVSDRIAKAKANPVIDYEISYISEHDPYFHYKAETNWSLAHSRADLFSRLQDEVSDISYVRSGLPQDERKALNKEFHQQLKDYRDTYPIAVFESRNLTHSEYISLKDRQDLSEATRLAITKFEIADWSCFTPDDLTLERVQRDKKGKKRHFLERLEMQAYPQIAKAIDKNSLDRQTKHGAGISQQDLTHFSLRVTALQQLGIHEALDFALSGASWDINTPEVITITEKVAERREALTKIGINLMCPKNANSNGIFGALLGYLGLKTKRHQKRVGGKMVGFYTLCDEDLALTKQDLIARLSRNIERYGELQPVCQNGFVERLYGCNMLSVNSLNTIYQDGCDDSETQTESAINKNTEQIPDPPPIDQAVVEPKTRVPSKPLSPELPNETMVERIARLNNPNTSYCQAQYESRYSIGLV